MIYQIIIAAIYFLILYLIAFFSNLHYRDKDDILFISKSQWSAIFVMWLPLLAAIVKTY
jgi:hypothetical protein